MEFEYFSDLIHQKTTNRRDQRGLKKVTRPNMKKAYKRLTEDPKLSIMNEDKQISYFVGWFLMY
jgi:hypothetical protein